MRRRECAGCTTPSGRWQRDAAGQWWCAACTRTERALATDARGELIVWRQR